MISICKGVAPAPLPERKTHGPFPAQRGTRGVWLTNPVEGSPYVFHRLPHIFASPQFTALSSSKPLVLSLLYSFVVVLLKCCRSQSSNPFELLLAGRSRMLTNSGLFSSCESHRPQLETLGGFSSLRSLTAYHKHFTLSLESLG